MKTRYYCTCIAGQALCTNCRENTHRAKMFSAHEVVHMSKCSKESYRKVSYSDCVYLEQYPYFVIFEACVSYILIIFYFFCEAMYSTRGTARNVFK